MIGPKKTITHQIEFNNYSSHQVAFLLIFFMLFFFSSSAQLPDQQIHDFKSGRVKNDTSYIYWLPYSPGKSFFLIQGWESKHSHKGELALDFKMRTGTSIYAAREGIVTEIKEDASKGGLKDEFLNEGNHILIQHSDGTIGGYWHLQKNGALIELGDIVKKGQLIALSGNTGYSAFPHLHFWVYKKEGAFKTLPTRFVTKNGIRYLRPGKYYQSVHE